MVRSISYYLKTTSPTSPTCISAHVLNLITLDAATPSAIFIFNPVTGASDWSFELSNFMFLSFCMFSRLEVFRLFANKLYLVIYKSWSFNVLYWPIWKWNDQTYLLSFFILVSYFDSPYKVFVDIFIFVFIIQCDLHSSVPPGES